VINQHDLSILTRDHGYHNIYPHYLDIIKASIY